MLIMDTQPAASTTLGATMSRVVFTGMPVGSRWVRRDLAQLWGYAGEHGLMRGVVTPKQDNKIILFVTERKAADRTQYRDMRSGNTLHWEGPTDHFAEGRMLAAPGNGDEIHVFYRMEQRDAFTYLGQCTVDAAQSRTDRPSSFTLRLPAASSEPSAARPPVTDVAVTVLVGRMPSPPPPVWWPALLSSKVFLERRERTRRAAVEEERLARLLAVLEDHGGRTTTAACASRMDMDPGRLRSIVAATSHLLNFDGYEVIALRGDDVVLNVQLLRTQFQL